MLQLPITIHDAPKNTDHAPPSLGIKRIMGADVHQRRPEHIARDA
jgi:hypothetical protein